MAESNGFGGRLRAAREQAGMGLDEAGRRLRIEPEILDAIENEDFASMPPKYMTRSMVNSYAQLLGLNPTSMTRDFLDAEFQYQLTRSNGVYDNSQANNQISTRAAATSASASTAPAATRPVYSNGELPKTTSTVSYRQSTSSASTIDSAWQPGGYTRVSSEVASDSGRQRVAMSDADDTARKRNVKRNADGSIRRPHFTALEDPDIDYGETPSRSAAIALNPEPRRDYSRLIMIVGSVLAVVLIVVLIKVIFVPDPSGDIDPSSTVSGLTDPEQTGISTSTGSSVTRVPIKPTACFFGIQNTSDTDYPWVDIFTSTVPFDIDSEGDIHNEYSVYYSYYVEPGYRFQFEVTDYLYVRTNNPGVVTLTLNGERVEWDQVSWKRIYVVDFPAYLEAWEAENLTSTTE